MFDILPIVIQSGRKKRDTEEDEPHVYDSENNHHVLIKRELKTKPAVDDVIDYAVLDG